MSFGRGRTGFDSIRSTFQKRSNQVPEPAPQGLAAAIQDAFNKRSRDVCGILRRAGVDRVGLAGADEPSSEISSAADVQNHQIEETE